MPGPRPLVSPWLAVLGVCVPRGVHMILVQWPPLGPLDRGPSAGDREPTHAWVHHCTEVLRAERYPVGRSALSLSPTVITDVAMARDVRGTRRYRKVRDQVVREEPICWLQFPGCTTRSTTADHVIPFAERPDLAMVRSNLRGACASCNRKRGASGFNKASITTIRL